MSFGRRIPSIDALLQLPISLQSGLTRPEGDDYTLNALALCYALLPFLNRFSVIALILYTGPMFVVYNSILRRFPLDIYTVFSRGGNLFSTTIFVLVSAVQKISTRMSLPLGTKLYRSATLAPFTCACRPIAHASALFAALSTEPPLYSQ